MDNIKKNVFVFLSVVAIIILFEGCDEDPELTPGSDLNPPPASDDALDLWIKDNYVDPFNIEVVYKWQESLVDQSRYLFPPHKDSVQSILELIKAIWIEPYNQVAGRPFMQELRPSQLVLVGGINRNPSGTNTLGIAEQGKRITLFNINLMDKTNVDDIGELMLIVHHEYAHILHQSKPFDEEVWGEITPEGYTAQWFNEDDDSSREEGFISAYARSNENEDFAEMVAQMLTRNRIAWNSLIDGIWSYEGRLDIRQKEQLVASYYRDEYGLNVYELQDSIYNVTTRALRR
ncbi:MAG: hypothetical protein GDA51_11690 [Ekhidna sp.]|nr:hypothetical protein [Ekhidna sp.]